MKPAVVRAALAFVLLAACHHGESPSSEVRIVETQPCAVGEPYGTWLSHLEGEMRPEFDKGGVAAALATHPLGSLWSEGEYDGLRTDADAGRCKQITYTSDGLKIRGFVVRPDHPPNAKLPVILYARGGSRDFAAIDTRLLLQMRRFARDGFIVVGTQYRGGPGSEGHDEYGGRDVDDLMALPKVVAALPDADPERLFLYGGSRGGMMVAIALERGLRVRAAAIRAGLFDLEGAARDRPDMRQVFGELIPGYASDAGGVLAQRSALVWPGALKTPLLLLHAREDWRVPLSGSERLSDELARHGVEHRLIVFDSDVHQLVVHREDEAREVVAWFKAH
jgi:dipeptidyl aminopeptidase/acylaminoacyl peptidase